MKHTFDVLITDENNDPLLLEIEFEGAFRKENDGIGAYEFWGQRCYDAGVDYYVCEDVTWDKSLYTNAQNQKINAWLNENWETFDEKFSRLYEEYEQGQYMDYSDYRDQYMER